MLGNHNIRGLEACYTIHFSHWYLGNEGTLNEVSVDFAVLVRGGFETNEKGKDSCRKTRSRTDSIKVKIYNKTLYIHTLHRRHLLV